MKNLLLLALNRAPLGIQGAGELNSLSPGWCNFYFECVNFKCIAVITFISIYRVIAIRWMVQDPIDDNLILLQVLAWCHQTRRYLSQCWPRSMSPNGVSSPHWVNFSSQSSGNIMLGRLKLTFSVMKCFLTENVNSGSSLNNNHAVNRWRNCFFWLMLCMTLSFLHETRSSSASKQNISLNSNVMKSFHHCSNHF